MTEKEKVREKPSRGRRGLLAAIPRFDSKSTRPAQTELRVNDAQPEIAQTDFGEMRVFRTPLTPGMLRATH